VLLEVAVFDESLLNLAVFADDDTDDILDAILRIISNGAFPPAGNRDDLSDGRLRQLQDAMAFEAHRRDGGDYFVTTDRKGFVNGGRRERLKQLGLTHVVTVTEFLESVIQKSRTQRQAHRADR
jgi:hypothetical protein